MTQDFSILSIILHASIPVQIVMLILLLVSFFSWSIIFQRWREFRSARIALAGFEERFWSGMDLSRLYSQANQNPNFNSGQESIFRAGFKEFTRLRQTKTTDAEAVMEGVQRSMRVAFSREQEKLDKNLPFLATVGSTSPYVGLFGTVWGIMNSFLSLAQQNQASLQVVAPDIAEALIATAMGLLAAIPAVVAYNKFSATADQLMNAYTTFTDEFSSVLHRKVHTHEENNTVTAS